MKTCFLFLFSVQGGAIIFIDELDAIGTKRFGGEQSGDREVQRTMLELLNQLDGFSSNDKIKVPQSVGYIQQSRTDFGHGVSLGYWAQNRSLSRSRV